IREVASLATGHRTRARHAEVPLRTLIALLLSLLLLFAPDARARMLALSWDNDAAFGTDGAYSNGLRLSWLGNAFSALDCADCRALAVADRLRWLPGFALRSARHALNVNVEQLMITPHDISTAPRPGDFPYAGVLRLEVGLFSRQLHALTGYHLVA